MVGISAQCRHSSEAKYHPTLSLCHYSQDARLSGGYENVPTDDIHMRQVDFNDHWMYFLQEFIQPIQRKLYTGYFNSVGDRWEHLVAMLLRFSAVASESGIELRCSLHAGISVQASTSSRRIDLYDQSRLERHRQRLRGESTNRYNCSMASTRRGWALIHPGRLTHFHEGLPVTKGKRYIMVSFIDP
jgi:hypothetical protein